MEEDRRNREAKLERLDLEPSVWTILCVGVVVAGGG
jgi:hypothetical protein